MPAPAGKFFVVLRAYSPKPAMLDGRWLPPAIVAQGAAKKSEAVANVRLYANQLANAQRDFESGDYGLARLRLDQIHPDLRGWEYGYLDRLVPLRLTLKGHSGYVCSVSFSPDGQRIVSGSGDETVKVWDAATGQETLTLKGHSGNEIGRAHV